MKVTSASVDFPAALAVVRDKGWSQATDESLPGVESLADGAATIRVKFKTQPLNQGRIANELRRRLMGAFVGRGIRPFSNT